MQTHTDPIREREVPVRDSRAGMALLIVLGLLALLMITGVAFTILMRIERASASNLRHTSAARQMAKGGLAYAIAALNADIGTNRYPNWPDRLYTPSGHDTGFPDNRPRLHIPEGIFFSVDEEKRYVNEVTEARVLTAEAARYLPGALRHRAEIIRDVNGNDYARPEWIPVTGGGGNDIIGRYAYVILNTSGLLDANSVHTNSAAAGARWMGADPGELQLDPAVQRDVASVQTFIDKRKMDGRYETLPELAERNNGVNGPALANFDVFSYTVPDLMPVEPVPGASQAMKDAHVKLMNNLGGNYAKKIPARRIDISSEAKIKAQQARIEDAFRASGLNATQAHWAYLGLLDYVDTNNEPAGDTDTDKFKRPATEAMPLFSVFAMQVQYEYQDIPNSDDRKHTVNYDIRVFYSYPFQTPRGPFKLDAEVAFEMNPNTGATWEELLPPRENVSMNVTATPGVPFYELKIEKTQTITKKKADGTPAFFGFAAYCRAQTLDGSKPIRRTPYDYDNGDPVTLNIGMNAGDIADGAVFWSEAVDPRCNWENIYALWRANRDYTWEENPGAGGNPNEAPLIELQKLIGYPMPSGPLEYPLNWYLLTTPSAILDYFKIYTDGMRVGDSQKTHCDPVDPQLRAHVANRPLLSVGELGYLPIGLWLTINLYDHGHINKNLGNTSYPNNVLPSMGYHPVLDYFVIGDPDKGRRGRVNLNSRSPGVLGALFNKLPVQTELHTHTPATPGPVISASNGGACDDAVDLAKWLIAKGPFERLSDLGRFFKDTPQLGVASGDYTDPFPLAALKAAVGLGGFGEFEREALIRNTCNLATLRGQTFTIILRADAFSPRFGKKGVKQGNVLATAMAVAQVWRDTEPMVAADGTKNYPTFVQFFKILNE